MFESWIRTSQQSQNRSSVLLPLVSMVTVAIQNSIQHRQKYDNYAERKGYGQYPKEEVAGSLAIHEDGNMVAFNALSRTADYMNTVHK